MGRGCTVKGCTGGAKLRKFRFPAPHLDPERFLKWLAAAGRLDLLSLAPKKLESFLMCQQHFEKKFILRVKLSIAAIPTLNLPEANDVSGYRFTKSHNADGAQRQIAAYPNSPWLKRRQ